MSTPIRKVENNIQSLYGAYTFTHKDRIQIYVTFTIRSTTSTYDRIENAEPILIRKSKYYHELYRHKEIEKIKESNFFDHIKIKKIDSKYINKIDS